MKQYMKRQSTIAIQNKNSPVKPELLAPAGSLESFHAAIEAGADAVYLGLNEYNARLRAKNISMKTLSYLVPFAHKKDIKIHVALNTLVKQNELKDVIDILYQLEQIGVDAVIIQDLGVADIAQRYFPKLVLHASTQMVIHNSLGVKAVEKLGFKRVILARELTLPEIESIKKSTDLELEVFIHGALCYSLSGLCLASSYLGGLSGNRGRCTQVCRRRFTNGNSSGFFFSTKDLCALDFINGLKNIGITSFKIEGRMKGAEYIYTVVSSYRKVIDNPELIPLIKKELRYDFGREKTPFFLQSTTQKNIITASRPSGTGILLSDVKKVHKEYIEIETDEDIFPGDKIRLHVQDRLEGYSGRIIKLSGKNKQYRVYLKNSSQANTGDLVYLISRKTSSTQKWSNKKIETKPVPFRKNCPFSQRILKKYNPHHSITGLKKKNRLYLRINSIEWLYHLQSTNCDGIILQCGKNDLQQLKANSKLCAQFASKLILALPPFIPENDIPIWEKNINDLQKAGMIKWMCSQLGEKELIQAKSSIYADTTIWSINRATQQFLKNAGCQLFSYSPEDDILNLKATGNSNGFMILFSYIPLFISRIKPPLPENTFLTEKKECGYFTKKLNGLYYLFGEMPLCLFHRIDKLNAVGIHNFILDLSFCPTQKKILKTLLSHYYNKKKLPGTTLFNHKVGLK